MVRASGLLDGVTAPIASGFLIQEPMKRTSSSRRTPFFCSKRRICVSMLRPIFCSMRRNGRSTFCSKCLLEQPDALLDVLPDHLFEKLDPLFELLERLHGHRERDRIIAIL